MRKSSIILSPTAPKSLPMIGRRTSRLSSGSDKSLISDAIPLPSFLHFAAAITIFVARYAPSSRKKFSLYAACPDVSIARSLSMPCSLSSMDLFITFLYPLLKRRCLRPRLPSRKLVRPREVTLSVTTVEPGCESAMSAAASATIAFLFISLPFSSTAETLSTSVSKIKPKSVFASRTFVHMDSIASLSSGLGMWFGKLPSGSRNCELLTSAPSGDKTFSA